MKICPKCLKQWEDDALEACPDDGTELRRFNDQATRLVGTVLDGRWAIEKKIGEGGMGEVYRGHQVSVDRPVAVKVLRPAMATSEEYVNRFFREANLATTINHPNFVTIYDFGQAQEQHVLYLAMELLEGVDLSARMRRGRLQLDHILQIGVQICGALTAAHQNNIVHRDLKPENIFLIDVPGGDIHLKVLDFGIAKELGQSSSFTKTGQIFGTPEYMSPEQCQSRTTVDGRSDLYSLGCILYELICGRTPFRRETVIQTLLAQVSEDARDISECGYAIPASITSIVMRLLQKMPEHRFQSAMEVKEILELELETLRAEPSLLEDFMDSQRATLEFDRLTDSKAQTISAVDRRPSSLINLDAFEHLSGELDEPEQASEKRSWLPVIGSVALVVITGGLAAYALTKQDVLDGPTSADISIALNAAADDVTFANDAATTGSASAIANRRGAQHGRSATILATSMALAGPAPKVVKPRKTNRRKRPSKIPGERTKASVERRARKYSSKLVSCYGLRENPGDQGAIKIRFRINPDGSVGGFKVVARGFKSDAVETCMKKKVTSWRFAESSLGSGVTHHERTLTFRAQ